MATFEELLLRDSPIAGIILLLARKNRVEGLFSGTKKPGLVVKEHLCSLNNQPRLMKKSGGDLLSHRVPPAVPSALRVLASGFGM